MRRYIVLLLITGIVWAQTDFDKLVLKDGTTYFGEYIKIEGEKVFFKTKDAFALQPVSLKQIESLELKDGQILYDVSKVKYSLALEDYQTLSTKEKGIYDAKYNKSMRHWILYCPLVIGGLSSGIALSGKKKWGESDVFSTLSLLSFVGISGISYLALKSKDKTDFEKLNLNQKEKEIYEKAYLNTVSKRRLKYIVGSTIVTGAVAILIGMSAMSGFSGGGGKEFTGFGPT
jgi:hypothetical protein